MGFCTVLVIILCLHLGLGAFVDENLLIGHQFAGPLKTSLWPNPIPYKIESMFESVTEANLKLAMSELEARTCIKFKEQTNETGYMSFKQGDKCNAGVGYVKSYASTIMLSRSHCRTKGWVLHYIMKSLGFMVESNRPDRDQYVKVVWDNIPTENYNYFKRRNPYSSSARYFNIPYDYSSIMHPYRYYKGNYSITLMTLDYYQRHKIGQRQQLSDLDVLSINLLYKCPGSTKPPLTIPSLQTDPPQPELIPTLQEKAICGHLTDNIQCPFGYGIWVEKAMYGRENNDTCTYGHGLQNTCSSPVANAVVKEKCHGKMECRLHAYNREFGGDPCPGTYKYLSVKYRCTKTDTMCFIAAKTISCPDGQVLKILDAMYGRMSKSICPTIYMKTLNCQSEHALETTKKICEGKQSCKVFSSHQVYGDPCPKTLKYLEVTHQCVYQI